MIKKETGEKREFNTGAKKQHAAGKGTPVLFPPDAYIEISKHFEEGGITHGARNWEKGIPLSELMNSLERHIAQEKMGLTEESHDRALAWNAVVYLATKLRIKAGILPKELDDLEGAYVESEPEQKLCSTCDGNGLNQERTNTCLICGGSGIGTVSPERDHNRK